MFIRDNREKKLLFLELGVGYNTPWIIRYPFEKMTDYYLKTQLIRINQGIATVPDLIKSKSIGIDAEINQTLKEIEKGLKNER